MGKINALTHLFNAGEVSRAALNRVDKEVIRLHAERQENLIPYSIGKAIMRPGLEFLAESLNGDRPRLIPFVKGIDDVALIEMTDGAMRVWIDDELVTRDEVDCDIVSGDFSSSTGWTTSTTGGGSASIADGVLTLSGVTRGGSASCKQEVDTSSVGSIHALRIEVARGPVTFRVGSSDGGDEYIDETDLDTGTHSLAFTHTGATSLDENTVLLLHCNGADTSTTFTDSSDFGHVVTVTGNAQIDTSASKFGGASAQFDGSGDRLNLDGSADFAFGTDDFTIDMWVYHTSSATNMIYDSTPSGGGSGVYPKIYISNNRPAYEASDGSILITNNTVSQNVFNHYAVVRRSGETTFYLNGVVQGTATDTNDYSNGASRPQIGSSGTSPGSADFNGRIDELRVSKGIARWSTSFTPPTSAYAISSNPGGDSFFVTFSTKLERQVIVESIEIEDAGVMELTAPWDEDNLREIRTDQSNDVVFMACGDWQPRRIERRSNISWSLVKYEPNDGPFTTARTAAIRIKPTATRGNTTLTADASFFRPEHVGALFRLDHERFNATFALAGEEAATGAFRVRGILDENEWDFAITGTWVGTLTQQRSFDGADTGFADTGTTHTINASGSVNPSTPEYDNQIFWMRYIFKTGEYTSGTANLALTYPGFSSGGVCRITGFTSATSVSAELLDDFGDVAYTADWREGDWSDRRGWPEAVGLFDGRLWWARRDRFWGSESDDFYAFNLETEGDAGSIQRSISAGGYGNQTQWIMGLQRLILGTNAAPMSCRSSSFDEPLTPTNITVKPASTTGAARVSPITVGSRGIYVGADGRRIHELAYDVDAQDYLAKELNRIHEDLADSVNPDLFDDAFVELAFQNAPEPYLWALKDDGMAANCLYNPSEEARGWFKVCTGRDAFTLDANRPFDRIVSAAALPQTVEDRVYFAVERTISDGAGGTERVYYIEKMARHSATISRVYDSDSGDVAVKNGLYMADSYITATGLGSIGQVFTGLTHIIGRDVIIIGEQSDGSYGPVVDSDGEVVLHTVSDSGTITSTQAVTGTVCIGLPYSGFYKSAKLAFAGQAGTALIQKKRVEHFGLALLDTHPRGILIGQSFDEDEMSALPELDGEGLARGEVVFFDRAVEEEIGAFPGHWDTDSRVHLKIKPGYSAGLSAMLIGIETKER
jgi:hypothetical protein